MLFSRRTSRKAQRRRLRRRRREATTRKPQRISRMSSSFKMSVSLLRLSLQVLRPLTSRYLAIFGTLTYLSCYTCSSFLGCICQSKLFSISPLKCCQRRNLRWNCTKLASKKLKSEQPDFDWPLVLSPLWLNHNIEGKSALANGRFTLLCRCCRSLLWSSFRRFTSCWWTEKRLATAPASRSS